MADTPDTNAPAPATDDTPSPFRRFPYIQLAFCVACLAMTAWTWMRFSYCWGVTAKQVEEGCVGFYARVLPDQSGRTRCLRPLVLTKNTTLTIDLPARGRVLAVGPDWSEGLFVIDEGQLMKPYGRAVTLATDASRLHPASIAGIVVGAMGVFVFGLYLRRWVKERRAG